MAYPLTATELLAPLKQDLGITSEAFDDRLSDQIDVALQEIAAEGATLQDNARDKNLVLMYAAWRWRSRVDQAPMGPMLRKALNNRVFSEKAAEAVSGT